MESGKARRQLSYGVGRMSTGAATAARNSATSPFLGPPVSVPAYFGEIIPKNRMATL